MEFPDPTIPIEDERQVLLGYLDYFRSALLEKAAGVETTNLLPSGWTPAELVNHLRHVERRWLEWGFEGRPIADPWADGRDDRWHTTDDLETLERNLQGQAAITRTIVESHDLADIGQPSDRWEGA